MAVKVNANPAMIKWAREAAGYSYDDLPKTLSDAEKWETGEKKPTWNDLRNLAKKYKRPPYFYFLSNPPEEEDIIEFRSDERIEEFSPELRLKIRKAKFRRNAYIKINNGMNNPIFDFNSVVIKKTSVTKLAKHIRNYLNVNLEMQRKWKFKDNGNADYSHKNFLDHWKEVCFDLGILVFEASQVQESEM
ncbi:MAG: helix-turn-helix domain-containing protein, partial [Methanobrevibacter sp.]